MAQLVALMSGVVLGGVAEVVGSNLARGKIYSASISSVDSLYPSVYIYALYRIIKINETCDLWHSAFLRSMPRTTMALHISLLHILLQICR